MWPRRSCGRWSGRGRPGDPAGRPAGVHVRRAAGRAGPGDGPGAAAKAAHTGRIDEGTDAAVVSAATAAEGDAGADRDAARGHGVRSRPDAERARHRACRDRRGLHALITRTRGFASSPFVATLALPRKGGGPTW